MIAQKQRTNTAQKQSASFSKVLLYCFLCVLAVVYLAPLVWLLSVSFKTNAEVFASPFAMPETWQLGNYIFAWVNGKLGIAMLNSVVVSGATLIIALGLGSMTAFAIARMKWRLSGIVMTYILIGMMIPVHCVLIPLFVQFSSLGLNNSLIGLVIPYVTFSLPMTVFLMTNFFRSMPRELFEAACIDGCGIYRTFFRIAVPMARTGFFVAGLMTFVNNWNELLLAMVFISDPQKKTLPVTLTYFAGPYATNYVQMFAAIVIGIAPTVLVYCLFSNQIVEGLTAGAVKG